MKKFRYVIVLTLGLALLVWGACGSSGGDDDPIYELVLGALSAKQGPNTAVLEPYQAVSTAATGNFLTQANPAAKATEIITAILLVSNPGLGSSVPDQLILAAINMGFDMGNVAAQSAVGSECADWATTTLPANTTGTCADLATTNCIITSQSNGLLTVEFGPSPGDCSYNNALTGENQHGGLNVYGEIRGAMYPAYDPSGAGADCSNTPTVDCRDVWVTATSGNWGSGVDALSYPSAISAYVFNYDLNATPDLTTLPLFIVANLQIDNASINPTNVSAIFGMPNGLAAASSSYFGGIIDGNGLIWGYGVGNDGSGAGSQIVIGTLPIQAGGTLCFSVYQTGTGSSENPAAYVYQVPPASNAACGL